MTRDEHTYQREIERRRVRLLILDNVARHPSGLVMRVRKFGVEAQMIYVELRTLVEEGVLVKTGNTAQRRYFIADTASVRLLIERLRPLVDTGQRKLRIWREHRQRLLRNARQRKNGRLQERTIV